MSRAAVVVNNQQGAATGGVVQTGGKNAAAAVPQIPFTRASMEHQEPFVDSSVAVGSNPVTVTGGPIDVPAYGFMTGIILSCTAAGGAGANAVAKEDAPWSAIATVQLQDVNGAPIYITTGYNLYLANKYGGYGWASNPTGAGYTAMTTSGNFTFTLRIPVQISRRDALGALPNSNSSSTYKLIINQAGETAVYSTAPTTRPTLRWRAWLEAWAQPPAQGIGGGTNAVQPPALGTTQFWTETVIGAAAGQVSLRLPRVGNLIRNLIFVARGSADGLRATGETAFPADFQMQWDSHFIFNQSKELNRFYVAERFGYATPDNGVFVLDFTHDFTGHAGEELRDLWIPTVASSRLEIAGSFGAAANVTVLTNDVAPSGGVFL